MKGKPVRLECAPKIWKKLSEQQQKAWSFLNDRFVTELDILTTHGPDIHGHHVPVVGGCTNIAVVAHNLACEAVWELARQNILAGRKTACNK